MRAVHKHNFRYILPLLGLALVLSSIYIIPYRLLNDEGNSYYTFGYVGDEYLYAQRMQPLVAGATPTNPVNGLGDPTVRSPFFIEDACRWCMTVTGLDVVSFMWIWRWCFPLVISGSLMLLVHLSIPARRRPWTKLLRFAALGVSLAVLYALYDLVTTFPPLEGWLQRIPTNIEFPLSVLMACACIGLLKYNNGLSALSLGLCGLALIYLRPYAAIPWGIATLLFLIGGLLTRQLSWKMCLFAGLVVVGGLIPWIVIQRNNATSEVYLQMMKRYYAPFPYFPHSKWPLHLSFAAVLGILAYLTPRWRIFIGACALTLPIVTFTCGLLPIAQELLWYDRFGVFYLVTLVAAILLYLGEQTLRWRGATGQLKARRSTLGFCSLTLLAAIFLGQSNLYYNFDTYPLGPLKYIREDLRYLPGYTWLKYKTPDNSLVLLDDGYDWGALLDQSEEALNNHFGSHWMEHDDLFQIVAQRRVVYTNRLYTVNISNDDLSDAQVLFLGTFGLSKETPPEVYVGAIRRVRPDYIFWKKSAPVPRGYGLQYREGLDYEKVFSDTNCEIWKTRR